MSFPLFVVNLSQYFTPPTPQGFLLQGEDSELNFRNNYVCNSLHSLSNNWVEMECLSCKFALQQKKKKKSCKRKENNEF